MRGGSPVHHIVLRVVAVASILASAALGGSDPNDLAIAQFLITHGADVNAKSNDGWSCMDIALAENRTERVDLLREHGPREWSMPSADMRLFAGH